MQLPNPRSLAYLQPIETVMATVSHHMARVEELLGFFPINV